MRRHFSEYDIGYIQPEQKTIPPVSQTMKNLLKLFFGSSNGGVSQSVGSASQPNPYATGNAALSACTNGIRPWHQGARDRDHGGRVRLLRTDDHTLLDVQIRTRQRQIVKQHERKLGNLFYALMFSFMLSVCWMAQFVSVALSEKDFWVKVLYIVFSLIPLVCSAILTLVVIIKIEEENQKIREMRT